MIESTANSEIRLADPRTPWFTANEPLGGKVTIHARGYARLDGREWRDQELTAQILKRIKTPDGGYSVEILRNLIPILNGGWALVAECPDGRLLAAVDRVRSIPLFYRREGDRLIVGDDPLRGIDDSSKLRVDATSALEYLLAGYVTNGATLYEGLRQLRAGEIIEWNPSDRVEPLRSTVYYAFCPDLAATPLTSSLEEEFEAVSTRWFTEFANSLRGERVVVPLSGGLDSRFVAAMLKRVGVEDVLCFTYGTHEDEEVTCSRDVAAALGYPWRFIRLDEAAWAAEYRDSASRDYWRYGAKSASMPLWQDFPAVHHLARDGYEGENTIYFPGLSGDMVAGSHLQPFYRLIESGRESVEKVLVRRHYSLWPLSRQTKLSDEYVQICQRVRDELDARLSPTWRMEAWDFSFRQGCYIVNSLRAYEFFAARWRTMWDYEFMDFFTRLPVEERFGQRFYLRALRNKIFTGPFVSLTDIPIAGKGKWKNLDTLKQQLNYWQYKTRQLRFGLGRKLLALWKRIPDVSQTESETRGMHDACTQLQYLKVRDHTRLDEVLNHFGIVEKLPEAARQIVDASKNWPINTLHWNGVFSAVTLCSALASNYSHSTVAVTSSES